ncbi:chemotaxis protein CheB [Singulisphaera acidiphila]|uniref:protein-glutamate methylesterase n=1 Tax=Singulisphaera acidiphila (strain ATCC BAA-1392 / DSM 18658 / VKM B-2454 / MOB10) TaxID=886293 RepID=L0D7C6_SINAD|nr:chemotaxis protein CheB [Singulisphaera acidiphila]AGA24733.1 chemotaxis response regulator containing a CheY-like receiver domain and a methylesterase domain [Singulisphaera acidiphila DSM 18658]
MNGPPRIEAVVVGASAGAVDALSAILPTLPPDYPLPLLVVVHLPADKKSIMTDLFRAKCLLDVHEAEEKEPIRGATAYFAPPDYHLLVEPDRRLSLSSEEPVHYCRPSIDVLFETAVDAYGAALLGIILTGANDDGARGLRAIHEAGGTALVQRPQLAYASTMPQAALDACPQARALSLEEIAIYLQEVINPA